MSHAQDPVERIEPIQQQAASAQCVQERRKYDIQSLNDLFDDQPQSGEPSAVWLPLNFSLDDVLQKVLYKSSQSGGQPAPHVLDEHSKRSCSLFGYRSVVAIEGPLADHEPVSASQHTSCCEYLIQRMKSIGGWCDECSVDLDSVLQTVISDVAERRREFANADLTEPRDQEFFLERWKSIELSRNGASSAKTALDELKKTDARFDIGSTMRLVRDEILHAADLIEKPYKGPSALSNCTWLALTMHLTPAYQQSFEDWRIEQAERLLQIYETIPDHWSKPALSVPDYHTLQSQLRSRVLVQKGEPGTFSIYECDGGMDWTAQEVNLVAIRRRYPRPGESAQTLLQSIDLQSECSLGDPTQIATYRGWHETLTGKKYALDEWSDGNGETTINQPVIPRKPRVKPSATKKQTTKEDAEKHIRESLDCGDPEIVKRYTFATADVLAEQIRGRNRSCNRKTVMGTTFWKEDRKKLQEEWHFNNS